MANRNKDMPKGPVFTIADLQEKASEKLPKMYRDFFNEGSMDQVTLRDNEHAFNKYKIRPRILTDVSNVDTSTTIFGQKVAFPLGFAPAAMHKIVHPEGETATSRAAAKSSICMALSSYATTSLEEVIAQGRGNPHVMQLSMLLDRKVAVQQIKRAQAAGYKAIFLTVDAPVLGLRLNEHRNNFQLPAGLSFPNLHEGPVEDLLEGDESKNYDASLVWSEIIPWLRSQTNLELWLKGVYTPQDVQLAISHGLDGVLISNHGGRQLDSVPATLDVLRECAPIAKGKIQIAVDGGIRRGSDIFKAIALGAQHCFVGRIPIWGIAYDGQEGAELAVRILMNEFKTTMTLAGCRTVGDIRPEHLSILTNDGRLAKL